MVYFEAFMPFFAAHLLRLKMETYGATRGRSIRVVLGLALIDVSPEWG